MPDCSASGDTGAVTQLHKPEVDDAYLLYTAVQPGHNSICPVSADIRSAGFRDGSSLSQHLYACHDFLCNHLYSDPDGGQSQEASMVRKWAVPPRTLPGDLHGKLYSRGKASHRESDLAAGSHYTLLRPDHAVAELEEKSGRAVSVFPDS